MTAHSGGHGAGCRSIAAGRPERLQQRDWTQFRFDTINPSIAKNLTKNARYAIRCVKTI
jgi:hypothetical protein